MSFGLLALPPGRDELEPLRLPEEHPAHAAVRELELLDVLDQHDDQARHLGEDLRRKAEDVDTCCLRPT